MYDVVIVGGGPAGVTAALRAREMGASVALVERGRLGGTCTNDGCAPTRVLAKAARLLRESRQFADYGLLLESPPLVDFPAMMSRTQQVVYQLQEKKQLIDHLNDVQVEVFSEVGNARFLDANTIGFGVQQAYGEKFVLCVGGSARRLSIPGIQHTLTHSDVWTMKNLPKSLIVVGGGATGCQIASVFEAFGAQVTLIDIAPRILLTEDELVAQTVAEQFIAHGLEIITGIDGIDRIEQEGDIRYLHYRHEGQAAVLGAEAVLMAVGWPGNIDALNLTAAGVKSERGYIQVDDFMQTTAAHIYAAGDITGKMMLVQSANHQALVAVENALLGPTRRAEHRLVPHGGFTDPEYGGVGLTEKQAAENANAIVAVVPYADMDRAVIDGHSVGFCKLIIDRASHRLLGAHVVGEQAVEVVQIVAAGIAGGMQAEHFADLEFAYPTFSAIIGLAARQLLREVGSVPVAAEWHTLKKVRGAEWERKE